MQTLFAADAECHLSDRLPEQLQRSLLGGVVIGNSWRVVTAISGPQKK